MMQKNKTENRRQSEIIGILIMTISVLVAISFASYTPRDELLMDRYFLIENAMGIIGVFVSTYLIKFGFGYLSWGLLIISGAWGWWIFSGRDKKALIRFSVYLLMTIYVVSVLFSIPAVQRRLFLPLGYVAGGMIGGTTADLLQDWIGKIPATILMAVFLLILLFSYLRISMFSPVEFLQETWRGLLYRFEYRLRTWRRNHGAKTEDEKPEKPGKRKPQAAEPQPLMAVPSLAATDSEPEAISDPDLLSFGSDEEDPASAADESVPESELRHDEPDIPAETAPDETHEETPGESESENFEVSEKLTDDDINYDETSQIEQRPEYKLPSVDLLNNPAESQEVDPEELAENAKILTQTLMDFGVSGKVTRVVPGPVVTLYEVEPATGVRVNRISVLADDIARVMSAKRIRIIAPIPGKNVVGVEIPNKRPEIVYFKSIVNSEIFSKGSSVLSIALGKMVNGQPFIFDLDRMPHLLIAGTTGSGKSVCINTLIMSILYRAKPDEVKFIMVDPKKLELSIYKALVNYHLITSEDIDEYVITSPSNAVLALRSAEVEMERRYTVLSEAKVRNIGEYNQRAEQSGEYRPLPYIVVIIDELADLMITASREIEEPIARLAQMARAVGIHLVVATQRPSVDVITGVIRSNFPARIAFQVPTKIDSRTILDTGGAEKLLGKGDMLFLSPGTSEPVRVHNSYVVLEEIEAVLDHISGQSSDAEEFVLPSSQTAEDNSDSDDFSDNSQRDSLFDEALRLVVQHQQGSISLVQRRLRVGYSRAARLIDELEHAGIVGPFTGSKAREVLVGPEYIDHIDSYNRPEIGLSEEDED